MKHWVVNVEMHIGVYEKNATHLVTAVNDEVAEEVALRAESHNDDAGWLDDQWLDDYMVYYATSCKEVTEEEFKVLEKYL